VVPVIIQGYKTTAVIDTAAMVSLVDENLFHSIGGNKVATKKVKLKGLGQQDVIANLHSQIEITVGSKKYKTDIYVTPMVDNMILGLDFLHSHQCQVDLRRNTVTLSGEVINATLKRTSTDALARISRVITDKTVSIAPNTIGILEVTVEDPLPGPFVVEPFVNYGPLLSSVVGQGSKVKLKVVNDCNRSVRVNAGEHIANAEEIDHFCPIETNHSGTHEIRTVNVMPHETSVRSSEIPKHLEDLLERSSKGLDKHQKDRLKILLTEYSDVFAEHDLDIGYLKGISHKINTGNSPPVKHKMRRTPLGFQDKEEEHINKLLEIGVIVPSTSDWASAPVLVKKKDGSMRYCIDYRALNSKTVKDCYPLPIIEDCLDLLYGTQYFSTLDLASGYYQIEIDENDRHKTAFLTKFGLFEHKRMGFGLCNAPATFQRAMQLVLRGLTWQDVLVYLDDVVVLGKDFENAISNIRKTLDRFRQHNMKLKPKKCSLLRQEVEFLGRVVSRNGVSISPEKLNAVRSWPKPTDKQGVMSFLGFANYHRDHIQHYAEIVSPLYDLVNQKNDFVWTGDHDHAFNKTIEVLTTAPVLTFPSPEGLFILDTDASHGTIGAVLSQLQEGQERVICYASHSLLKQHRRYCTTRKELLAVVKFCRHFRHYLLGRRFLVRTDHNSLTWLMRFKHVEGQLARWLEELSQFDMEIIHRKGKDHCNADGLSRISDTTSSKCDCYQAGSKLETLPCRGCPHCTRAHHQWDRFENDVDDVVPLAVRTVETPSFSIRAIEIDKLEDSDDEVISSSNENFAAYENNWMDMPSKEKLREMQLEDLDIHPIINWLERDKNPSPNELRLHSPATRALWMCRGQLCLQQGVLYYTWKNKIDRSRCLVVPKTIRNEVLRYCHDLKTSGHMGQDKTLMRLKQSFYWYNMNQDSDDYVRSCGVCNTNKRPNVKPRSSLQSFHAGHPMERVHLDILGPFNTSALGNNYVLVMVDQFSKWVELAALPDQSAMKVAWQFVLHFIVTFGCPLEIFTDQGKNFDSNLFKALCDVLQIAKRRTTPYHPSSNGQVERYNRTILQMIRCYIEKKAEFWDRDLPLLAMALHSTVNRQTGLTPNRIMLGRETIQPCHLMLGNADSILRKSELDSWVKELEENLAEAHEFARTSLKTVLARQKRTYDLRLSESHFEEGDLVYVLDSSTQIGQSKKLRSPWKGPFLVIDCRPPLYTVKDQKKEQVLHHDRLKLCQDRSIPVWLRRMRNEHLQVETPHTHNLVTADSADLMENISVNEGLQEEKVEKDDCSSRGIKPEIPNGPTENTTNFRKTRAGRNVRPPKRWEDFSNR